MGILRRIAEDNKITPEDLPKLEAKLFFEGPRRLVKLEQFVVLLFLSTVIASYGVLGDSTATVIGAMIIAPLMRPMMATAAGLVIGDMKRAGTSFFTNGSGERPALAELGTQLGVSLDRPVEMKLVVVPSEQELYLAEPE